MEQYYGYLAVFFGGITLCFCMVDTGHAQALQPQDAFPVYAGNSFQNESRHSPTKATILSLALPGAGQVYNRKIWKVPIIYAGLGATGYAVYFNRREYQRYRQGYLARVSGDEEPDDEFTGTQYTAPVLKEFRDFYRSNYELSVLGFVLIYLLNGVDAFVDAHLFEFDVSDDLGIRGRITPASQGTGIALGIGLSPKTQSPVPVW